MSASLVGSEMCIRDSLGCITMPPSRRGGHRQERAQRVAASSSGGDPASCPATSALATALLEQFFWDRLSATGVQSIARAAMLD
eukprot:8541424-Alexandrium_andersonii.AAC.1